MIGIPGQSFRPDPKRSGPIVQTGDMEPNPPDTGEIALAGWTVTIGQEGAVNRHGLGRILDAVGRTETIAFSKGMVGVEVAHRSAEDRRVGPLHHLVQETHGALVGNVGGNPAPV